MKWIFITLFSGAAVFGTVKSGKYGPVKNQSSHPIVILELFTSEGCSSCPAADKLLPGFANLDPNVIPLSFHVDYWDSKAWKDPFSNSKFSNRQQEYGTHFKLESIYTPQLIVNGQYELVGSNRAVAESDIQQQLKQDALVQINIFNVKKEKRGLSFTCELGGNWQGSELLAALVQKHAEMSVRGGENHGANLSHTNVVRSFTTQASKEKMNFELSLPSDLDNNNWEIVVYSQQKTTLQITGAATYVPASN